MNVKTLGFAGFLALTLLPLGWNKIDIARHAQLLYLLGPGVLMLAVLSWRKMRDQLQSRALEKTAFFALFSFAIVALLMSSTKNVGWGEVSALLAGLVLFFTAQVWNEREQEWTAKVITVFSFAGVVLSWYWYLHFSENRMAGFFFDADIKAHFWPNAYALFLLMTWPIAAGVFKKNWTFWGRIMLPAMFATLILTFSRAALLTFMAQIAVLIFMNRRKLVGVVRNRTSRGNVARLLIAPLVTIVLTGIFVGGLQYVRGAMNVGSSNSFAQKLTFQGTEKVTSVDERAAFFKGGWYFITQEMTPKTFLFGTGPGSFPYLYPKIQTDFLATSDHPHDWYIKIAMEYGIPALLALLILIITVFWSQRRPLLAEEDNFKKWLFLGLFGALVHTIVDYNFNFLATMLLFWCMLGMLRSGNITRRPRGIFASVIVLCALVLSASTIFEGVIAYQARENPAIYEDAQFPRNYFLDHGNDDAKKRKTRALALEEIRHHLALNSRDASAWNALGNLYEKLAKKQDALNAYQKALDIDPANHFVYYLNWFRMRSRLGMSDPLEEHYRKKAEFFLAQYGEKLKKNIHYTAQTRNASDFILLKKQLQ